MRKLSVTFWRNVTEMPSAEAAALTKGVFSPHVRKVCKTILTTFATCDIIIIDEEENDTPQKNRRIKHMKVIKTYDEFNPRRYSVPWVAIVNAEGKIDFSVRIGGYTGDSRKGEAGQLYITDPKENTIYAFGQKDYRGNNSSHGYIQFKDGKFISIPKAKLIDALIK